MGHRHSLSIHRIVVARPLAGSAPIGIQMADELMAVKIEVHPVSGTAAFGAPQNVLVEAAGFVDVAHLDGNVKRCQFIHSPSIANRAQRQDAIPSIQVRLTCTPSSTSTR